MMAHKNNILGALLLLVTGSWLLYVGLVEPAFVLAADARPVPPPLPTSSSYSARARARMLPVVSDITLDAFGKKWFVKDSKGGTALPGPCVWTPAGDKVWSDDQGLHLTVAPRDGCGGWASTEAWLTQPLGYGTYLFRISGPFAAMDPEVVFGLFTWDDDCPGDCHFREIDFELARWGNEGDPNAGQWVVQPWSVPGNLRRFSIANAANLGGQWGPTGGGSCNEPGPDGFGGAQWQQLTLVMQWYEAGLLRFYVFDGHHDLGNILGAGGKLLASWEFPHRERVPKPGDERIHFNLWQANWGGAPRRGRRVHVVVRGFEHTKDWKDFPAAGIYPSGRRLAVYEAHARPTESPERLAPTKRPAAKPPTGAVRGVAAPAGVDATYATFSQVLGDYETALRFYDPMMEKGAEAATQVGSDGRRLQFGAPDPTTETVVILPPTIPVPSVTTTPPGTTTTRPDTPDPDEETSVGAPVPAGGSGTGADSDASKRSMTIGLAVMGVALAAVGVGVAAVAFNRVLRRQAHNTALDETPALGAGARVLRRTGPGKTGHDSTESGDTTTYASWREPWSAATPDYGGQREAQETAERAQARASAGGQDQPAEARASGSSPHHTHATARHRTGSAGAGYSPNFNEGPAQAVAHGHHTRSRP